MVKYTKIYSGGVPEFKEDDIFRTVIPLENDQDMTKINDQDKIIRFCTEERTLTEIMEMMKFKHKSNFRNKYILPLIESGKLQRTIPDKPNSKNQKYISK